MEPEKLFDLFFSFENPAIYGIIIVLLIMIVVTLVRKEFIQPLTRRKLELEIENTKLMALFAEIDPDPILRIDYLGKIISANETALRIFNDEKLIGANISSLLPEVEESEQVYDNYVLPIGEKFFSVKVRNIEYLQFKQIYFHDITARIKYERQIEQYQKNLRQLRAKREQINESEKQRLGQELHDSIGQNIAVIKIELQKHIENEHYKDRDAFIDLLKMIDELSNEIREISYELRPRILNDFGLFPALSSLIDSINSKSTMKGEISYSEIELNLNKELELNIYRICQEALTNIVKHSNCNYFFIQFVKNNDDLKIIISDDGIGFNMKEYQQNGSSSLGLLNMKERISNFNGSMNIIAEKDEGTTIFFNLPSINKWKNND